MNIDVIQPYLVTVLILSFIVWRVLKFKKVKNKIPEYLKQGALVVDVRSSAEFHQGARPGSINIPLGELDARADELDRSKMIILCCASGSRSGVALGILRKKGFSSVVNAGSWMNTLT